VLRVASSRSSQSCGFTLVQFAGINSESAKSSNPVSFSEINFTGPGNRGVHVIVIGHMATEETPNTLGANYLTHTLDMDKAVKASMIKWAGNILFLNIDINIVTVTEVAKDKTVLTGKAKDSDKRVIWTETSPGHIAKNRMNLPPVIKMGSSPDEAFKNFWKVLPDPYKRAWPVPGCEVK